VSNIYRLIQNILCDFQVGIRATILGLSFRRRRLLPSGGPSLFMSAVFKFLCVFTPPYAKKNLVFVTRTASSFFGLSCKLFIIHVSFTNPFKSYRSCHFSCDIFSHTRIRPGSYLPHSQGAAGVCSLVFNRCCGSSLQSCSIGRWFQSDLVPCPVCSSKGVLPDRDRNCWSDRALSPQIGFLFSAAWIFSFSDLLPVSAAVASPCYSSRSRSPSQSVSLLLWLGARLGLVPFDLVCSSRFWFCGSRSRLVGCLSRVFLLVSVWPSLVSGAVFLHHLVVAIFSII